MQEINKIETGNRIRELRESAAETQEQIANLLGVKRQIISYYENGTRVPNLEHLIFIARHYNTSTDYLLGLSNVPTIDKDIKFICDYTGLAEENIDDLFILNKVGIIGVPKKYADLVLQSVINIDFLEKTCQYCAREEQLSKELSNLYDESKSLYNSFASKKLNNEDMENIKDCLWKIESLNEKKKYELFKYQDFIATFEFLPENKRKDRTLLKYNEEFLLSEITLKLRTLLKNGQIKKDSEDNGDNTQEE